LNAVANATVENVLTYFNDIFGVETNDFDKIVMFNFITEAVMLAYKTGVATTEPSALIDEGEIVDAEFTIVEVTNG
jgi:hypothetical protein